MLLYITTIKHICKITQEHAFSFDQAATVSSKHVKNLGVGLNS
jgi:hypothetical protein